MPRVGGRSGPWKERERRLSSQRWRGHAGQTEYGVFGSDGKKKEIPQAGQETFTFLARGFEFKGILTFEGTVRIDGTVAGEIRSNGTIILGEHAVVEGDVSARTIVSGGTVTGNVMATERVHLLP